VKPYWSISEACAWIVTRDLDAVEHVSNSDPEAPHFLLGGDALPLYQFCEHVFEWPASCSWHALTQIQQYCGDERITMFGVPQDDGIHMPIPGTAWAALGISHSEVRGCFVAAPPPVGNPSAWWTRLRLRSADVSKVWPQIATSMGGRRPASERHFSTVGRPRAWDWDGAIAHLAAVANRPDGLPDIRADAVRMVEKWRPRWLPAGR
jgi:hypothetical protein